MPPKSPPSEQPELFRSALLNLVDRRHPLVRLAGLIDWETYGRAVQQARGQLEGGDGPNLQAPDLVMSGNAIGTSTEKRICMLRMPIPFAASTADRSMARSPA